MAKLAQSPERRATPRQRVRALLACPFTPWIREATIGTLLADPQTREITIEHLGLDSPSAHAHRN